MQYVSENSGYLKSIRTSLSSSRQGSRQRQKQLNNDILGNINYMIKRLDQLQEAIQTRQYETKEQLKTYANKENQGDAEQQPFY